MMALNFSHRPIFSAGLSEDNLRMGNGYRVDGISETGGGAGGSGSSGDGFGNGWHNVDNCFDYGGSDRCDRGGGVSGATQDSVSKDILDLLPSDPFGMDISTTFTAITGWLEDLDFDYGGYHVKDEIGTSGENYPLFAGLNFIWNNAVRFHTFPQGGNVCIEEKDFRGVSGFSEFSRREAGEVSCSEKFFHGASGFNEFSRREVGEASCSEKNFQGMSGFGEFSRREVGEASCSFGAGSSCDMDAVLDFRCDYKDVAIASVSGDTDMDDVNFLEGDERILHSVINSSLRYLGLSDLLVLERVCKSLHSTVRDPQMWTSIHIDQPLNERITDDILLELTNRAQGLLQCLSLVECTRITDDGLRRVLEFNPKLSKLSVPGCTRLSIEGIVGMLKAYNSMGTQKVKHLHIGGLYGVTQKHFEQIKLLLGTDKKRQENALDIQPHENARDSQPQENAPDSQLLEHSHKPHFYCRWNLYLPCDDDRDLDIEVCPRCQNLRLVYDCPAEGCQGVGGHATQLCRACTLCIPRCSQCGRCINDSEYEETFCLELLCSHCSQHLVKPLEGTVGKIGLVSSVLPEQS